jgi:hypothetical protein
MSLVDVSQVSVFFEEIELIDINKILDEINAKLYKKYPRI